MRGDPYDEVQLLEQTQLVIFASSLLTISSAGSILNCTFLTFLIGADVCAKLYTKVLHIIDI
jgi:hypothetical protein